MISKRLSTKVIATVGAITLMSAGAAAAASGTIPSPFASERAEEVTADRVPDIARASVAKHLEDDDEVEEVEDDMVDEIPGSPDSEDDAGDDADVSDELAADAVGPDATGPAKFGLCTAYAAKHTSGDEDDLAVEEVPPSSIDVPVAFRNLNDAATEAGQTVEEFCADATPGGADAASGQSADNPSVTAPGQSADNPSVTAPGQSAENPSVTAPGQSADNQSGTTPARGGEGAPTAPGRP